MRDLTFNRVGRGLVLGGKYWNLGTMKPVFDVQESLAVAFSGDGGTVAILSTKNTVDIHEVASGRKLAEFPAPGSRWWISIPAIALSRSGTRVAIAGEPTNEIVIWDVKSKTKSETLTGHQSVIQPQGKEQPVHILAVGFTDGDRVLYSGSSDGAVLLWNVGER